MKKSGKVKEEVTIILTYVSPLKLHDIEFN